MPDLASMALAAGGGALGGVGLWTFLGQWIGLAWKREEKETDRLRDDLAEARREHKACEERLDDVERRLEAVEHHHASLVARWIKDANKRVVWINSAALIQIFAPLRLSRSEVEGRTFQELLAMEAAREIDRLDRSALAFPGTAVSTLVTLHSQLPPMHVVKVAGVGRDGELIYEGYAYCVNAPADARDRGQRRQEEQCGLSQLRMIGPPETEPDPKD